MAAPFSYVGAGAQRQPVLPSGYKVLRFHSDRGYFRTNSKYRQEELSIGRNGLSDQADEASTHGEQSKRLKPPGKWNGHWQFALTPAIINECA